MKKKRMIAGIIAILLVIVMVELRTTILQT